MSKKRTVFPLVALAELLETFTTSAAASYAVGGRTASLAIKTIDMYFKAFSFMKKDDAPTVPGENATLYQYWLLTRDRVKIIIGCHEYQMDDGDEFAQARAVLTDEILDCVQQFRKLCERCEKEERHT